MPQIEITPRQEVEHTPFQFRLGHGAEIVVIVSVESYAVVNELGDDTIKALAKLGGSAQFGEQRLPVRADKAHLLIVDGGVFGDEQLAALDVQANVTG